MLGLDSRAARYTWTAVVVLLLLRGAYEIRETIFVLILAILFAYMLVPLVNRVNRLLPGKSRAPGLAITYLLLVAVLVVVGVEIGSRVAEEATSLVSRAPQFVQNLQTTTPNTPNLPYLQVLKGDLLGRARTFLQSHSSDIVSYLPSAGLKVLSFSSYLVFLVLVPIISFFLLKDGGELHDNAISLIPAGPRREMWVHILADTNLLLGQYVRAVGTLCLTTFVVFAIVFSVARVPYGILLATIAFPLEFIPLVGPLTAAVVIITVTLATGYEHWGAVIIFLGVYRLLQDYVLSPRLMSAGVEVHPLLVILGVLAGEKLGGVPGMFLSVPIIAFARVLYRRFADASKESDRIQVVR
jgi:predicted PurR-regulated permease PerM